MTFATHLLHCVDGAYYCGHTDNLLRRIAQHQTGECGGFTASRLPVELVWTQEFASRIEALAAERQIKGWRQAKKEALIASDWAQLSMLTKKQFGKAGQ